MHENITRVHEKKVAARVEKKALRSSSSVFVSRPISTETEKKAIADLYCYVTELGQIPNNQINIQIKYNILSI